ncbi:MAG: hypothetical protein Q8942_12255 [Bacillota bacterium]|nr:hypothetical protein [Bacillota bacterium]
MLSFIVYLIGLAGWFFAWLFANGYKLMKNNRMLLLPFIICIAYLLLNMLFALHGNSFGSTEYEESRFDFIDKRVGNLISATSSVIVVATIIYGITVKKLPVAFVKFMILSYIFQLSVSAPILWIPQDEVKWFSILRNFQTVGFIYGLFLCISGIIMLLNDLTIFGTLNLDKDDENPTKQ